MSLKTLEAAVIAVVNATDLQGRSVHLCQDPADIYSVRRDLYHFTHRFNPSIPVRADREEAAARNLALLANLLVEHLQAAREKSS